MNFIQANNLTLWNRWDIIIKYYYVYIYLLYQGNPPKWATKLYVDHILVLNGGKEDKTMFQPNSKNSVEEFIQDFNKLIINIKDIGFNTQYYIPVTHNDTIINGGHRISIGMALDINIPYKIVHDNVSLGFPSFGFKDREKYKHIMPKISTNKPKNNLSEQQNDLVALNLLITQTNYRIIMFFDSKQYGKKETQIKQFLEDNKTNIVYIKNIILTKTGIYKLTQHLYYDEKHVNVNWKTNQIYESDHKKNKYTSTVMIIYSKDNKIINLLSKSGGQLKNKLREIMGNHHQVHITDNEDDTNMIAKLVLHQPSLDFINIASVNNYSTTLTQLTSYKKYIQGLYKIHIVQSNKLQLKPIHQNMEQFQDMFCLCSSYIMTLYGIRKNLDIDFIYDTDHILDLLRNKINQISHNKYQEYYHKSIKDLIYDPDNYFYYLGMKCLKLENVLKMKMTRNEKPKDINDIQQIQLFQRESFLKHYVTIITVSHVLPSAPSTQIIERMLTSLHDKVEGSKYMNHMIFVDTDPVNVYSDEYIKNLNKLRKQYNNLYIIPIPHSGLKTNYINGIKLTTTPYIYFIEHDWIFNEKIPTICFVNLMNRYSDINYIKMSKRDNNEVGGWDKIILPDKRFKDLVKTDSWTNHPHIVRKEKWVKDWFNIININKKAKASHGIEEVMYKRYQKNIYKGNFESVHKEWGCYNWLSRTGKSPIKHIDGSLHYVGDELNGFKIE